MVTSRYFNHFDSRKDQNLWEDIIIESIQHRGIDCYYLPRTLVNQDDLFGEDTLSKFENAHTIECYVETADGFEGEADLISKFGIEIRDSVTLSISKKRFEAEITSRHNTITRPREGDLVYFPLSKGIFEIQFVEHENPFYQEGKTFVYRLRAELFSYSQEDFDTGVTDLDNTETNRLNSDDISREPYAQNEEIEEEGDAVVNFDEANPFGLP